MLFLPAWSTLLIFNLTLRINSFSSQYFSMTLHICQSFLVVFASCKITISPNSSSFQCLSISSFLEVIARILSSSNTRIHSLCVEPTFIFSCCINQVSKNLLEVARLSLISRLKDLMETGANYWSDHLCDQLSKVENSRFNASAISIAGNSSSCLHQRRQDETD